MAVIGQRVGLQKPDMRVDHAHTLEQFDTVQKMLSTAEDRIDEQDTRLHELSGGTCRAEWYRATVNRSMDF